MTPSQRARELSKTGYEVLQRFRDRDTLKVFPAIRRSHDLGPEPAKNLKVPSGGSSPYARNSSERQSTEAAIRHRLRNEKTVFMTGQSYEPVPIQPLNLMSFGLPVGLDYPLNSKKISTNSKGHCNYQIVSSDDRDLEIRPIDKQALKLGTIE